MADIKFNKEFIVDIGNLKVKCYAFKEVVIGFVVLENIPSEIIVPYPLVLNIENSNVVNLKDCNERLKYRGVLPVPPKTYQITLYFDIDNDVDGGYSNECVLGILHPDEDKNTVDWMDEVKSRLEEKLL